MAKTRGAVRNKARKFIGNSSFKAGVKVTNPSKSAGKQMKD